MCLIEKDILEYEIKITVLVLYNNSDIKVTLAGTGNHNVSKARQTIHYCRVYN